MEDRIAGKRTMETARVFCIVTLSSVLFQTAAYVNNYKISLLDVNGADYFVPQTNRSSCSNKIDQPILKMESKIFIKEYPETTTRTLNQPQSLGMIFNVGPNPGILSEDIYDSKKYAYSYMRRIQGAQNNNKQYEIVSERAVTNILSRRRHRENKKPQFLDSRRSTYLHDKNRRITEHGLKRNAVLSSIISEPSYFRRSVETRNFIRETNDNRRTKYEKEYIKATMHVDQSRNFVPNKECTEKNARNSFVRLLRKEQNQRHVDRCNKVSRITTERRNLGKQRTVFLDSSNKENINSVNSVERHDSSLTNLILENNKKKVRNSYSFFSRVQYAPFSTRSRKSIDSRQKGITERMPSIVNAKQFLGQESRNAIITFERSNTAQNIRRVIKHKTYERRNTAQNSRRFTGIFYTESIEEFRSTDINIQFYKKLERYTYRTENTRRLDVSVINKRYRETFSRRNQNKISREGIPDRIRFLRDFQRSMEKTSTNTILKQTCFQESKQLYRTSIKILGTWTSEIFIKDIQIPRQVTSLRSTQYRQWRERMVRGEESRIYLEKYHNSRQYPKWLKTREMGSTERRQKIFHLGNAFTENASNTNSLYSQASRIEHEVSYGGFLSEENVYLTRSRILVRDVSNRLFGNALQKRIQHKESSQQSFIRSWYIDRSEHSARRISRSRYTQRLQNLSFNNRRIADESVNLRTQYGIIRRSQYSDRSVVRNEEYKNLFRDQKLDRERREKVIHERRYERISEIADKSGLQIYQRKQTDPRKLYRYSKKQLTQFAKISIKQTGNELGNSFRESFIQTRNFPKIKLYKTERVAMPSGKQQHIFKSSSVPNVYNLSEVKRKTNDNTLTRQTTSLKSIFPLFAFQQLSTNENAIEKAWNTATNILNVFSKVDYNSILERKEAYFGHFCDGDRMEKQLFFPDHTITKRSLGDNWKAGFKLQDVIIAGVGIFAAVKLHATKSME